MRLNILFFILFGLKIAHGAKILGVFTMPGISHHILGYKLMTGLANAGHDVTVISPYQLEDLPKNGSYTQVVLDGFQEQFNGLMKNINLFDMEKGSPREKMTTVMSIFTEATNNTFYHPNVKKLLQSNQKFDAVIMEQFANDAHKVFAHIYNCPLIILSSIGPNAWVNPSVGNPQPVSYVPHMFNTESPKEFSFIYRAKNMLFYIGAHLLTTYFLLPAHDKMIHQGFPDAPTVYDLYTNVSLVLLNSHTSMFSAVPLVPNMIEIGGYFIDPPKKLPDDLQEFLDNATEGVIYFSMGSNLRSKDLPEDRRNVILNVFRNLKQKVLWKFEEDLPDKPPNVMIKKWLPQQDILAHPNIKLFITHGGLLSSTETIYHGVPILAIPVFGDQPANADKAEKGGYGLQLNYNDPNFSEERLSELVNELLTNPKYTENVQMRSKIYHDRPQKPMETAVYWVEYVIRHRGAPHLRVAGVRMPWYQYFMVDVIAAFIAITFATLYIIKITFKKLFCKSGKHSNSNKKQKGD